MKKFFYLGLIFGGVILGLAVSDFVLLINKVGEVPPYVRCTVPIVFIGVMLMWAWLMVLQNRSWSQSDETIKFDVSKLSEEDRAKVVSVMESYIKRVFILSGDRMTDEEKKIIQDIINKYGKENVCSR